MKSTKTVLAVAIVIAGFVSFGCGSDVAGGVSIADARETCDEAVGGSGLTDSEFNTVIIQWEAVRDDGFSELIALQSANARCIEVETSTEDELQCIECVTAVVSAVWP